MSTADEDVRARLRWVAAWLEEGKRQHDELTQLPPSALVDAVAELDRKALEKVVLYRLLAEGLSPERLGQESATFGLQVETSE